MEKYISAFSFSIGFISFLIVVYYLIKYDRKLKNNDFVKFWVIMSFIGLTLSGIIDGSWYRTIIVLLMFPLLYFIEFIYEPTKILIMDSSGSNMSLLTNRTKLIEYLRPHFGNKKFILLESRGDGVFRSDVTLDELNKFKFIDSGMDFIQDCIDWVDFNFLKLNKVYILTDGYLFKPLDFHEMKNDIIILKTIKDGPVPIGNKEMTIIGKDINPIKKKKQKNEAA